MTTPRTWTPAAILAMALYGAACQGELGSDIDVQATLAESVPTVVLVTISDAMGTFDEVHVEYGADLDYGRTTQAAAQYDGTWLATLMGLKPAGEVHYRAVIVADGESITTEDQTITTGPRDPRLSALTVEVFDDQRASEGYLLVPLFTMPDPAVVLIDTDGEYVWWYFPDTGFEVTSPRARMARDGQSVLVSELAADADEWAQEHPGEPIPQNIRRVGFDGEPIQIAATVTDSTHDWVELPDGSFAFSVINIRSAEQGFANEGDCNELITYDSCYYGEEIVEIGADGERSVIWNAWEPDNPFAFNLMTYNPSMGSSWVHLNAIDWNDDTEQYLVGSRGMSAILLMGRDGQVTEVFGGDLYADLYAAGAPPRFSFADDGHTVGFEKQHQFVLTDDELLVFDNGPEPDGGSFGESRAVRYSLDHGDHTMTQTWDYSIDLYQATLGDVVALDGGAVLVDWSSQGQFDQVGDDGELLWRLNASLGNGFGYVRWLDSL